MCSVNSVVSEPRRLKPEFRLVLVDKVLGEEGREPLLLGRHVRQERVLATWQVLLLRRPRLILF
jgi:hypothetical protein